MDTARQPRLMTRAEAATYCGLSLQSFSRWVRDGLLPKALAGTARWDARAVDLALDRLSGISPQPNDNNPFDLWMNKRNAHTSEGNS